jgi:hypothetical protein
MRRGALQNIVISGIRRTTDDNEAKRARSRAWLNGITRVSQLKKSWHASFKCWNPSLSGIDKESKIFHAGYKASSTAGFSVDFVNKQNIAFGKFGRSVAAKSPWRASTGPEVTLIV